MRCEVCCSDTAVMLTTVANSLAQVDATQIDAATLVAQADFNSIVSSLIPAGTAGVAAMVGILAVLALIDSTSFGTLLIPVWLLMAPGRLRVGRILFYLFVVGGSYALIGLAILSVLLFFGDGFFAWLDEASGNPIFLVVQLAIGAGLIMLSLRLEPMTAAGKERKRLREEAKAAEGRGTAERMRRFRERAIGEGSQGGTAPLVALALTAVGLEIATLLPYLAGIGLVAANDPGIPIAPMLIVFYCLVMLAPALVLLIGRIVARKALERPLQRLEAFMSRHSNGAISWIVFLLGLYVGLGALGALRETGLALF